MLHVFKNSERRRSKGTDEISEYITASTTHLPVAADDGDEKTFKTLMTVGAPEPVPDGLAVTVMCSNGFLRSLLG